MEQKTRILIVDDDPDIVETLRSFLCRKGYDVKAALSGEEALLILEQRATDLILLDMKMAGMGGETVARIIKEKYPQVKIVVVTAYKEAGQNLFKEHLLEDLLIKPVSLKELYTKLLSVLDQKEFVVLDPYEKQHIEVLVLLVKARILMSLRNLLNQNYSCN